MKVFTSDEDFNKELKEYPIVIALFGSKTCMPCVSLKQKLDVWQQGHQQVKTIYIPVEEELAFAASQQVFTAPTILVYVEGKISLKESGYFSLDRMLEKVEHYLEYFDEQ